MIEGILKYKNWDQFGELTLTFYEIELIQDIGEFKKGTKFDWANIDYEKGLLELGNKDDSEVKNKFKLKLQVDVLYTEGEVKT